MSRYSEVDLGRLHLIPVAERSTRVSLDDFGQLLDDPQSALALVQSLPGVLAGRALGDAVEACVRSHRAGRPVVLLAGAHVFKVGVVTYLGALVRAGILRHVAVHGAGAIHDVEMALFGTTSEDVGANLTTGAFGMVRETPEFYHGAAAEARARGEGLGEALGRWLLERKAPHASASLLAECYAARVPATVHVAIGTDTIHAHPAADGAALGETSLRDFRILAHTLLEARGATVLNVGSAVILPEVFLKALSVARNLGASIEDLTTVNFDQIQHYRPRVNVVERPTQAPGSHGLALTGHHEILIPLFVQAVLARAREPVAPGSASRTPGTSIA